MIADIGDTDDIFFAKNGTLMSEKYRVNNI